MYKGKEKRKRNKVQLCNMQKKRIKKVNHASFNRQMAEKQGIDRKEKKENTPNDHADKRTKRKRK